jgi:hypothetical protein
VKRVPPEMLSDGRSPLLRTSEVAVLLRIPASTLKWWRTRSVGRGPDFIKLSPGHVRYSSEALRRYLRNRTVRVANERAFPGRGTRVSTTVRKLKERAKDGTERPRQI